MVARQVGLFGNVTADAPSATAATAPTGGAARTLRAETARGKVVVEAVAVGVVRIQVLDKGDAEPLRSYAVASDLPALDADVGSNQAGALVLTTADLSVSVDPHSGALAAVNAAGTPVITEAADGFAASGKGFRWQLALPADESCHGLGQRAFPLSLRDRKLGLWNYDARSYSPGSDPLYLSVPFYLGHRPGLSYGIFWDNPARGTLDLDTDNSGLLSYTCERRPLNAYLVTGDNPQQVVQRYAGLTGYMELVPLWALGYHQSRWSYLDAAAFRSIAARMRSERIPCDALHFDIDYMDGFRVFTWNKKSFPDPKGLLAELKADGFNAVAILDPGIKADAGYAVYREGASKKLFLTAPSGGRLRREVWAGLSEFPDFTNPDTRAWWADQVKTFARAGFVGLWNDMNEPSIFTDPRTLPDDTPHDWDGQGNTHVAGGHAVYGMEMARSSRDGLAALRSDRRPFVISRAGYAGLQRYATTWNGDSLATWEHLRITIPQLLNLGMSGIPFSGSDAGGFRGDPDSELYLRWMQLASMTPFFRTHSARTARERNPWTYGRSTTDAIRRVVELRYRLLPYFYTLVHRASTEGVPIARPMFFERPDSADYPQIDDQFMLGDSLLVAPILERDARSRDVVLPPGDWYRYGESGVVSGDRTVTDSAGLGLPLYVRAGAVIPTWPVRQSTSEKVDTLTLRIYAGSAQGRLYEDAGDGYGYRDGEYRLTTYSTTKDGTRLIVTASTEGDYTPPYATMVQVYGLADSPAQVRVDGKVVPGSWRGGVLSVTTGTFRTLELDG